VPLLVVVCIAPVSLLVSVTFALGTAAPEGSSTVPTISPVVSDCADKKGENVRRAAKNANAKKGAKTGFMTSTSRFSRQECGMKMRS
jgi:hypothetical protein